jgi:acetyltransferase
MTGHLVRDLPAALGFAAVVAAVAARPPAVLAWAPLRGLGTISYGLYLWHLPVLLWLRFEGLLAHDGFVGAWIEVAALSVAVAIASWVLVERPVIEAAGRWRPWTRRVPSFPADRHIRPAPSVA